MVDESQQPDEDFVISTQDDLPVYHTLIQYTLFALFLWQVKFGVSDTALEALLSVIRLLILLFRTMIGLESLNVLLEKFPSSLYSARKLLGLDRDRFTKYVVCPDCNKLYSFDECWHTMPGGKKISKKCDNVLFPNHPQKNRRKPCGAILMKSVLNGDGTQRCLYPKKVYSFRRLKDGLEELLARPGFRDLLFLESRKNEFDEFSDVTDGNVYKTFKDQEENDYFADKRNLGLMLNIDWFNPFKNSEHSIGVIYLAILNLPREHRFKWENILIVGIIPGPSEPKFHVNSFLAPFVDELLSFWEGQYVKEPGCVLMPFYRLALLCISSDIPATRKCGGFMSFNATKGMSLVDTPFSIF